MSIMCLDSPPETSLRELMLVLLTPGDLRRLLFDSAGQGLVNDLQWSSSASDLFFAAVEALDNRGMIDDRLFKRLVVHAPGRLAEICEVARRFDVDVTPESALSRQDCALLEQIHTALGQPDPIGGLALIQHHSLRFFPVKTDGVRVVAHLPELYPEHRVLRVATTVSVRRDTKRYTWTYYGVAGVQVPLLTEQPDGDGSVWQPSTAANDALGAYQCLFNEGPEPFRHRGERHLFYGRRRELDMPAKLATWTRFKDDAEANGILLHTMDGFLDRVAARAFGDDWYHGIPPESPLTRPL